MSAIKQNSRNSENSEIVAQLKAAVYKDLRSLNWYLDAIRSMSTKMGMYTNNRNRILALDNSSTNFALFCVRNYKKIFVTSFVLSTIGFAIRSMGYKKGIIPLRSIFFPTSESAIKFIAAGGYLKWYTLIGQSIGNYLFIPALSVTALFMGTSVEANRYFSAIPNNIRFIADTLVSTQEKLVQIKRAISDIEKGLV